MSSATPPDSAFMEDSDLDDLSDLSFDDAILYSSYLSEERRQRQLHDELYGPNFSWSSFMRKDDEPEEPEKLPSLTPPLTASTAVYRSYEETLFGTIDMSESMAQVNIELNNSRASLNGESDNLPSLAPPSTASTAVHSAYEEYLHTLIDESLPFGIAESLPRYLIDEVAIENFRASLDNFKASLNDKSDNLTSLTPPSTASATDRIAHNESLHASIDESLPLDISESIGQEPIDHGESNDPMASLFIDSNDETDNLPLTPPPSTSATDKIAHEESLHTSIDKSLPQDPIDHGESEDLMASLFGDSDDETDNLPLTPPPTASATDSIAHNESSLSSPSPPNPLIPVCIAESLVQESGNQRAVEDLVAAITGPSASDNLPPLQFTPTTSFQALYEFVKNFCLEQPTPFNNPIFQEDFLPQGGIRTYEPHCLLFCTPTVKYPDGRQIVINCDLHTRKYHTHWSGPQCDEVGTLVPEAVKARHRAEVDSKGEDHAVWNYSVILRSQGREQMSTTKNWTDFELRIPAKIYLVDGRMQQQEPKWIDVVNTARAVVSRWAYTIPLITPLQLIRVSQLEQKRPILDGVNVPRPEVHNNLAAQYAGATVPSPQQHRPPTYLGDVQNIGMPLGHAIPGSVKPSPAPRAAAHPVPQNAGKKLSAKAIRDNSKAPAKVTAQKPARRATPFTPPPAGSQMASYLATMRPIQQAFLAAKGRGVSARGPQQPPLATPAKVQVPLCPPQQQQQQAVATAAGGYTPSTQIQHLQHQLDQAMQLQQQLAQALQQQQQLEQALQQQRQQSVVPAAAAYVPQHRVQQQAQSYEQYQPWAVPTAGGGNPQAMMQQQQVPRPSPSVAAVGGGNPNEMHRLQRLRQMQKTAAAEGFYGRSAMQQQQQRPNVAAAGGNVPSYGAQQQQPTPRPSPAVQRVGGGTARNNMQQQQQQQTPRPSPVVQTAGVNAHQAMQHQTPRPSPVVPTAGRVNARNTMQPQQQQIPRPTPVASRVGGVNARNTMQPPTPGPSAIAAMTLQEKLQTMQRLQDWLTAEGCQGRMTSAHVNQRQELHEALFGRGNEYAMITHRHLLESAQQTQQPQLQLSAPGEAFMADPQLQWAQQPTMSTTDGGFGDLGEYTFDSFELDALLSGDQGEQQAQLPLSAPGDAFLADPQLQWAQEPTMSTDAGFGDDGDLVVDTRAWDMLYYGESFAVEDEEYASSNLGKRVVDGEGPEGSVKRRRM